MVKLGHKIKIDENLHHRAKVVARKRELLRQKADQDNQILFEEQYGTHEDNFSKMLKKYKGTVRLAKHRTLWDYIKDLLRELLP